MLHRVLQATGDAINAGQMNGRVDTIVPCSPATLAQDLGMMEGAFTG